MRPSPDSGARLGLWALLAAIVYALMGQHVALEEAARDEYHYEV